MMRKALVFQFIIFSSSFTDRKYVKTLESIQFKRRFSFSAPIQLSWNTMKVPVPFVVIKRAVNIGLLASWFILKYCVALPLFPIVLNNS